MRDKFAEPRHAKVAASFRYHTGANGDLAKHGLDGACKHKKHMSCIWRCLCGRVIWCSILLCIVACFVYVVRIPPPGDCPRAETRVDSRCPCDDAMKRGWVEVEEV